MGLFQNTTTLETAGIMSDVEKEKDKLSDVDDDVIPFYKEAFQCFDWNNSGRISTSVSKNKLKGSLNTAFL